MTRLFGAIQNCSGFQMSCTDHCYSRFHMSLWLHIIWWVEFFGKIKNKKSKKENQRKMNVGLGCVDCGA